MTAKLTRSKAAFAIFMVLVVVSAFLTIDITTSSVLVNEAYREINFEITNVNITITQGTPSNVEAVSLNVTITINNPTASGDLTFKRINSVMYARINESQPMDIGIFEITQLQRIDPMTNETVSNTKSVTTDIANDLYQASLTSGLTIILDCSIHIGSPLGDQVTPATLSYTF